jgi:uncharacterized membrane protein
MADQAPTAPTGIPAVGATEDEKTKGALAYIIPLLTGIIVLLIGGDSKFLKFHALQSIVYGIVIWIIAVVLSWVFCLGFIIWIVGMLYAWYGAYMIYTGKPFEIPVIADFVKTSLLK